MVLSLTAMLAMLISLAIAIPAAASIQVEVMPAQVELTLEPGETAHHWIGVKNHDSTPVDITVLLRDFRFTPKGRIELLEDQGVEYSATAWLDFPASHLRLGPGEQEIFDYDIDVPETAEPGGHFAAVVFQGKSAASEASTEGATVDIIGQVVGEILITVPGEIKREATVAVDTPLLSFATGQETAVVTITNTGNVHLTPNGYLKTWGGIPSAGIESLFGQFTILPGASREFEVPLTSQPWLGRARAQSVLEFGPHIGVFDDSVEGSKDFLVFSWKIILILDLVLVGFDIVLFREWRRRRRLRDAKARG